MNEQELLNQIVKIFNTGEVSKVEQIFSSEYVDHQRPDFIKANGPEEFKQIVNLARKSLPNLVVTVVDLKLELDKLIARLHWHSLDENGHQIERETLDTLRFVDGQFVEHWGEELWEKENNKTS